MQILFPDKPSQIPVPLLRGDYNAVQGGRGFRQDDIAYLLNELMLRVGALESIDPTSHEYRINQLEATIAALYQIIDITVLEVHNSPLSGTQNGVNTIFTTPSAFATGTTKVSLGGARQTLGEEYTETGPSEITFVEAPLSTQVLRIDYVKG